MTIYQGLSTRPTRRVKRWIIQAEMLVALLRSMEQFPNRATFCQSGQVPPDLTVVGVYNASDGFNRIEILVESETFAEVTVGGSVPEFSPCFCTFDSAQ
jgi:hypothetical protein